jgi:hypothetical protein
MEKYLEKYPDFIIQELKIFLAAIDKLMKDKNKRLSISITQKYDSYSIGLNMSLLYGYKTSLLYVDFKIVKYVISYICKKGYVVIRNDFAHNISLKNDHILCREIDITYPGGEEGYSFIDHGSRAREIRFMSFESFTKVDVYGRLSPYKAYRLTESGINKIKNLFEKLERFDLLLQMEV